MACCLPAPSPYLNQCWHMINSTLRYSKGAISQEVLTISISKTGSNITLFTLLLHLPGANELSHRPLGDVDVIFKYISVINVSSIFCEIAFMWMPLNLIKRKSTYVKIMTVFRQATSHYLSQCWPKSMSPYGITRPQWVNERGSAPLPHLPGL